MINYLLVLNIFLLRICFFPIINIVLQKLKNYNILLYIITLLKYISQNFNIKTYLPSGLSLIGTL